MNPLISVIVVNYNGLKYLGPCLTALVTQSYKFREIILVDNGSSDGSAEYVRKNFPQIFVIESETNQGFAGGTNAGIRLTKGEFILTLNNDTIPDHRFIENISIPMIGDPLVGMCASRMIFPDGSINSTGLCISRSGAIWDRGFSEQDSLQYEGKLDVFGPCGGAALYRRSMLDEIGLFDEDFFLYAEDADLAFRARWAGWICRYVPSAIVTHLQGGTAGIESDISVYYINRNQPWCVIKNFPVFTLLTSFPWIAGKNCADLIGYILKGKGGVIIRAKIDCLKGIGKMWRKREDSRHSVAPHQIGKWIL